MDISSILSYGAIGLSFLLAGLAFKLITQEQKRENPRTSVLRAVYAFMAFCVLLLIVSIYAKLTGGFQAGLAEENEALAAQVEELQQQVGEQEKTLGRYHQRQKEYEQNYNDSVSAIKSALNLIPTDFLKKPAVEALEKLEPRKVE